jgi:hypothetical protein
MKIKLIISSLLSIGLGINAHAQLLDKLKQRAKEKGLETRAVSFDSTDNQKNRTASFEQEELQINSAKDFFNADIKMVMHNGNNQITQVMFFDAGVIAMRTEQTDNPKPLFHDRKGFVYGYNDSKGYYEKASILPSSSMGFMMASMIPQAYKLPSEPYLEAFQALQEKEIGLNFLILELAFIYKPSHFMDDENYIQEKVTCNGANNCVRFNYNIPDYSGSYIQFDDNERLVEFFITTTNPQFTTDNPTGKFIYTYQDCTVNLPDAVEQSMIPGPLGKMLNLERGLEPWKHNKKDN